MAILKAFRGFRPPNEIVKQLAARPYDVLNSQEAREEVKGNPYSLLHITKPEIDLPANIDEHEPEVYLKAKDNFTMFRQKSWLVQDKTNSLYIYAQTMNGRTQYGIVGCAAVSDYMNGVIKKHELTRHEKEEDRMKHVRITNANLEPVFFTYPAVAEIDVIVKDTIQVHEPEYDFVAKDGVTHKFWIVNNSYTINKLIELFQTKVPYTYIADGHHRTAAAALVGNEKRMNNPNHKGTEEYNFFLAVHFPGDQLNIIDYNRVVKDLNKISPTKFLEKIKKSFDVKDKKDKIYKPGKLHNFSMYLDGHWYSLNAKKGIYDDKDPIGVLDVTILSKYVLSEILGIHDLRTDKRIDFVGGIRGLGELKNRVDSKEMKVAFALHPVSMNQLFAIADTGNIMPPKTTWFEPKLRSGLVVHSLE